MSTCAVVHMYIICIYMQHVQHIHVPLVFMWVYMYVTVCIRSYLPNYFHGNQQARHAAGSNVSRR